MITPPAPPGPPAIDMRGVSIAALRDPRAVVVEEVNWTVAPGDFWVVGGLQGSGKSDLLMVTGGVMAPSGGTYRFLGEEMPIFDERRLAHRLRLGVVFDGGQLLNHLTVARNIALPLQYHRNLSKAEEEEQVGRMLALTGLESWADSTPGVLGRNWQQRAGLARALMLRPEVLLLDSPLAGLDAPHRAWWLKFLGQLAAGHDWMDGRPMTLVVTADELGSWRGAARRFAALGNKRLVILGGWDDVAGSSNDLVRELLAGAPGERERV